MTIVITTPTGNIGAPLARQLLEAGETVTLVARDPGKVKSLADRGARVVAGSHDDASLLVEATRGAAALFVLAPPDMRATDLRAAYRRFGEAAAKAIEANRIGHVVHLSSVGAELQSGTGPIVGLYENERILARACKNLVQLRPAYFMENTMMQIPAIQQAGALFTTLRGDTRIPMIATRDIAARAAALLAKRDWSGLQVVELQGGGVVSYDDVARILSEVLARPLRHTTIGGDQFREALVGMGVGPVVTDGLYELSVALEQGRIRFHEPRSASNSTPTSHPVFAQEVFGPAFRAASAS
jgi:uncharacterized protein YbjT (DUF2867 family)